MSEDTGVWAYAITEHDHLSGPEGEVDLSWLTGVGEAKVRTATCSGLTALVSDVSLAEFGDAALRQNFDNLDWLDEVAREHHYVIDAAVRLFPLLPVRLATVYSGDAAVCAALTEHNGHLVDALHRVGGRVEWGVKAYATPDEEPGAWSEQSPGPGLDAAEPDAVVPDATGLGATGLGATGPDVAEPGKAELAHLKRRAAQLSAARQSTVAAVSGARAVHAGLTAKATATRIHPAQSAQLSGLRQPMLLNASYLLDPADAVTFTAAVAGQATAHPELRIELTGPWPPYSFADEGDEGDGQ